MIFSPHHQPASGHAGSRSGAGVSVVVHLLLLAIVFAVSRETMPKAPEARLRQPSRLALVYMPPADSVMPLLAERPAPAVPVIEPKMVVPPRVTEPVRPAPAPEPPAPTPAPAAARVPPPPSPEVRVGAFPDAARTPSAVERSARIEVAGFDAPVESRAAVAKPTASVGEFDRAPTAGAPRRPGNEVVSDTGFGAVSAAVPARAAGIVADAGFGRTTTVSRAAAGDVKTVAFDAAPPAPRAARAAEPRPAPTIAVEVLSKPAPIYTDEARRLKVEGDVVLEVEFTAAGSLKIIRTVKGLGHGLDEAAAAAASRIRFKPAQRDGRPVDYRTTIQIVFRLA